MSNKQARLIAAIKEKAEALGVTNVEMARIAGATASAISQALGGKMQMREERWRMICEHLKLDYDEIVADLPLDSTQQSDNTVPAETPHPVELEEIPTGPAIEEIDKNALDQLRMDCMILASYAAHSIESDIRKGIDISAESLRLLLNAIFTYTGSYGSTGRMK